VPDDSAERQSPQAGMTVGHKGITRIFTLHDTHQAEALGQIHRHVFQRVHRQIGTPLLQSHFKLFDKQALATNLAQCPVQDLIALRGHSQYFDLMP
jgi:hypothetical protein